MPKEFLSEYDSINEDISTELTKLVKADFIIKILLLVLLSLMLICMFMVSKELSELVTEIKHYTCHTYGCCNFYY